MRHLSDQQLQKLAASTPTPAEVQHIENLRNIAHPAIPVSSYDFKRETLLPAIKGGLIGAAMPIVLDLETPASNRQVLKGALAGSAFLGLIKTLTGAGARAKKRDEIEAAQKMLSDPHTTSTIANNPELFRSAAEMAARPAQLKQVLDSLAANR